MLLLLTLCRHFNLLLSQILGRRFVFLFVRFWVDALSTLADHAVLDEGVYWDGRNGTSESAGVHDTLY